MILKDFLRGGFPIGRRSPVLCLYGGHLAEVACSNAELKKILEKVEKPILMGFWPGKKGSDVFVLNPAFYGRYVPPAGHDDVDSAEDMVVFMGAGKFDRVEYVPGPHAADRTKVVCSDPKLYEYINDVGLRHRVEQGKSNEVPKV